MKVSIMAVVLAASMLFCNEGLAEHKTCWCVASGCVYEFEANGSHMSVTSKSESGDEIITVVTTDKDGHIWRHDICGGKVTTTDNERDINEAKRAVSDARERIRQEQEKALEKFDRDMERLNCNLRHMFDR